jgi:hypothetical protein
MSFPCILAARNFRPGQFLPFRIGGLHCGWISRHNAPALQQWPEWFDLEDAAVTLASQLDTPKRRTAALEPVCRSLAASGHVRGWRNEHYAIRNEFDAAPLALIERAAARFFGSLTFGVHVNGIVAGGDGDGPRLWLARRSLAKFVDPGKFDNVVGGGIGWGYGVMETLVKECAEESGIPPSLASRATPGRRVSVLAEIPEGLQWEQIFTYDLPLPADFVPRGEDGEVSEHRLVGLDDALGLIAHAELTTDAALVTLDWMLRAGHIDRSLPELEGFESLLLIPPPLAGGG